MRPVAFLSVLDSGDTELEHRDSLRRLAEEGAAHPRLPRLSRAERAASGRAQCRLCREPIEKGKFRLALQMFEDGRMASIGSIHLECAEAYFGSAAVMERVLRLTPSLALSDVAEIQEGLARQRPAPAVEETASAEPALAAGESTLAEPAPELHPTTVEATPDERVGPTLKKTQPVPEPPRVKPQRA
jgi:hypothetical protein